MQQRESQAVPDTTLSVLLNQLGQVLELAILHTNLTLHSHNSMDYTGWSKNTDSGHSLTDCRKILQNDGHSLTPLTPEDVKISNVYKSATILKTVKSPYLSNGLTDRHQIWNDDAH